MEAPTVDLLNPCYCPTLPATTFLQNLRRNLIQGGASYGPNSFFSTFARMLDPHGSVDDDTLTQNLLYDSENDWIVGVNVGRGRGRKPAAKPVTARWPAKVPLGDALGVSLGNSPSTDVEEFTLSGYPPKFHSTALPQQRANKRKRDVPVPSESSSSDPDEPAPKYGKSELLANDSSFELEVCRERVDFDATGSPTLLANEMKEQDTLALGDSDAILETLIGKVVALLPGIRLEERLSRLPALSVQTVADFLAENSYMNHSVLKTFQRTGVTSLCLSNSLVDEDGLNICGEEVIKTLGEPGCFEHLMELDLSKSLVLDFNLVHIHHLPKLENLSLSNTGIGNEAVYLLLPLKRTLKRLVLSVNPDITSESVPAMLLLDGLEFLSILDTGVDMVGLRLIAKTIYEESRTIDIEIPYACESYIDSLDSMYLVDIQPPLVTDPAICSSLPSAILKQNLIAHAEKNPRITTSGSKAELVARLEDILRRREMDLVVAQMLLGP